VIRCHDTSRRDAIEKAVLLGILEPLMPAKAIDHQDNDLQWMLVGCNRIPNRLDKGMIRLGDASSPATVEGHWRAVGLVTRMKVPLHACDLRYIAGSLLESYSYCT
jgi:hypothetical protein